MDKCALYLVRDHYSGAVKIGISKHPEKRLKQIADHYHVGSVSIVQTTWFTSRDAARSWELNFHRRYAASRSLEQGGREWFDLTTEQVRGFIDWMEASTAQRAFKAITVRVEVHKESAEILKHRWQAFLLGTAASFMTGVIPILGMAISGGNEAGLVLAPLGVGAYATSQVKKKKSLTRTYGINGEPIGPEVPRREYMEMKLWDERTYSLEGIRPPGWELPEKTSAEQATRFFERSE